jgi:hypothetical protein
MSAPAPTAGANERTPAAPRSLLRAVAMPTEHGGWGLTLEPGLLGLLIAPSIAGACLAAAALVAFLARTPVKIALVDRRRGHALPRTRLAARVAAIELVLLGALVTGAVLLAEHSFWPPAIVAAPLILVESWFEVRSRGRRLVPELAGGAAICSVASMIVLANGGSARLAAGVWAVLVARLVTSIPNVRAQINRLHGRPTRELDGVIADGLALFIAAVAVGLERDLTAGAVAIVAVVAIQRIAARGAVPRPVVLGIRQLAIGFGVVVVTALGVIASG